MELERAALYGSLAAKLLYLSADRPDLGFVAKELMRKLSSPGQADWDKLVNVGRYLLLRPCVGVCCEYRALEDTVLAMSDVSHAACHWSRKSTCGIVLFWGGFPLKYISRIIPTLCLSSAESELLGLTMAAAEGLGGAIPPS